MGFHGILKFTIPGRMSVCLSDIPACIDVVQQIIDVLQYSIDVVQQIIDVLQYDIDVVQQIIDVLQYSIEY